MNYYYYMFINHESLLNMYCTYLLYITSICECDRAKLTKCIPVIELVWD